MKSLFASLLFFAASQSALALPELTVDDLNLIDLRASEPQIDRIYNYPGLGGGNQPAPDCLLLVSGSDRFSQPENGLERLAAAISVFDGRDILFPSHGSRDRNTLAPQIIGDHLVFYFADLGTFLTGLRVEAKSGKSLAQVVEGIGFSGPLALQVVRGCRVLNDAP